MENLKKMGQLIGRLMANEFYVVSSVKSPDEYNTLFTINSNAPNREQELINLFEEFGWTGIVCGYQATPQDPEIPLEIFQPYYWVNAVTPDSFK